MSGYGEKGLYRGKRVRTEQDDYWSDRDEDACAAYVASLRSKKFSATPFARLEDGDTLTPSEAERNLCPENTL